MKVGVEAEYFWGRCLKVRHFVIVLFFVKTLFDLESGTLRDRLESCCRNLQLQYTFIDGDSYAKSRDVQGHCSAKWQPAPTFVSVVVLPTPRFLGQKGQTTVTYVNLFSLCSGRWISTAFVSGSVLELGRIISVPPMLKYVGNSGLRS
jgi:hypothetical protein